jgi:hypothetical protein
MNGLRPNLDKSYFAPQTEYDHNSLLRIILICVQVHPIKPATDERIQTWIGWTKFRQAVETESIIG